MTTARNILITGGTGYVGGRLLPILESNGYVVRCMSRRPLKLSTSPGSSTETVVADVLDQESLDQALDGVETAYYLIHSMGEDDDFEQVDRRAAENFARACSRTGVKQIIYLGGLGDSTHQLSKHLRSRQEIGGLF